MCFCTNIRWGRLFATEVGVGGCGSADSYAVSEYSLGGRGRVVSRGDVGDGVGGRRSVGGRSGFAYLSLLDDR